jgi:lysophospholipase L1-like esterase
MFQPTRSIYLVILLAVVLSSCIPDLQSTEGSPVQTTFYLDTSALSYGVFDTEATSLILDVSNTIPSQVSAVGDVSVEDEADIKTYKVGPGDSTIVHEMPAGKKQVTITSGAQGKVGNEIIGIFVKKISFNRSAIPVKQEGKQVLIYGDSLAVGGNVDNPSAEAWPVLLRKQIPVVVDGYGYRTLYDDALTAEARSKLAAKISSQMPDRIWLAIGTNDYAFETWSAQDFGDAYGMLVDTIHAAHPEALIFAQSPISRTDERPNAFGDNLENYRQQIAAACFARQGWCVFVDGTDSAFPQPDELDKDGIHLTRQSSTKYAEAVLNILSQYKE